MPEKREPHRTRHDTDRGERPSGADAREREHVAYDRENQKPDLHHRRRVGGQKRAHREVPTSSKARKLDRSHYETQNHSDESEGRRATGRIVIERAVGLDLPATQREISKTDGAGGEKKGDESDELLDGVRPLKERFWLQRR